MANNNIIEEGFAIRCPHCGNWYVDEKTHPSKVAVDTAHVEETMAEFEVAIKNKKTDSFPYKEKKMFRCQKQRWACPASFEAFIFDNEKKAQESLKSIEEKWAISRDFRLYKADKQNRWDKARGKQYFCIMFCTEPVPRQRDIELEHLIDPMLISKVIKAINSELKIPLTVYSCNLLTNEPNQDICWMPIEAYSKEYPLVPSSYNIVCKMCRNIVSKQVLEDFEKAFTGKPIQPENCPEMLNKEKTKSFCAIEPACMQKPIDYNHCPLFIKKRRDWCFCYNSDMGIVKSMIGKMRQDINIWDKHAMKIENECPAGFTEAALPIIVQEHLVGVAMSGQVFFRMNQVISIEEFIEKVKLNSTNSPHILEQYKTRLEIERCILLKQEKCVEEYSEMPENVANAKRRFYLKSEEWNARVDSLKENIRRIEDVAEIRYRDIRARSENAFRDELTGYTKQVVMKQIRSGPYSFFNGKEANIIHILKRMRNFWAFNAAGYLWWDHMKKTISIVGYSTAIVKENEVTVNEQDEAFGFFGNEIDECDIKEFQEHPISWLCDPEHKDGQNLPKNEFLKSISTLIKKSDKIGKLNLPRDNCHFIVIVPFEGDIYSFAFLNRDKKNVSHTPSKRSSAVSELCQEYILRTCTQMVYELCDVKYREEQKCKTDVNNKQKGKNMEVPPKDQQSQSQDYRDITGIAGMENI